MESRRFPPYVDPSLLDQAIARWLEEDVGPGDVTTQATLASDLIAEAHFLAKEPGVIAGLAVAERVFRALSSEVSLTWRTEDGSAVAAGEVVGSVAGSAHALLVGERLALNLMQRMSGIATATRRMADLARPARVLDTRKTAPGLRALDKWAVLLGGGQNHRIGLYDMVLVKDNHIEAAGGIQRAVEAVRRFMSHRDHPLLVEVEARTLDEVREVLSVSGVDWILLDNMARLTADGRLDTRLLASAVDLVEGRIRTEASGGVTEATIAGIAATGVDAVSCGALTHSVRALDISLKIGL